MYSTIDSWESPKKLYALHFFVSFLDCSLCVGCLLIWPILKKWLAPKWFRPGHKFKACG